MKELPDGSSMASSGVARQTSTGAYAELTSASIQRLSSQPVTRTAKPVSMATDQLASTVSLIPAALPPKDGVPATVARSFSAGARAVALAKPVAAGSIRATVGSSSSASTGAGSIRGAGGSSTNTASNSIRAGGGSLSSTTASSIAMRAPSKALSPRASGSLSATLSSTASSFENCSAAVRPPLQASPCVSGSLRATVSSNASSAKSSTAVRPPLQALSPMVGGPLRATDSSKGNTTNSVSSGLIAVGPPMQVWSAPVGGCATKVAGHSIEGLSTGIVTPCVTSSAIVPARTASPGVASPRRMVSNSPLATAPNRIPVQREASATYSYVTSASGQASPQMVPPSPPPMVPPVWKNTIWNGLTSAGIQAHSVRATMPAMSTRTAVVRTASGQQVSGSCSPAPRYTVRTPPASPRYGEGMLRAPLRVSPRHAITGNVCQTLPSSSPPGVAIPPLRLASPRIKSPRWVASPQMTSPRNTAAAPPQMTSPRNTPAAPPPWPQKIGSVQPETRGVSMSSPAMNGVDLGESILSTASNPSPAITVLDNVEIAESMGSAQSVQATVTNDSDFTDTLGSGMAAAGRLSPQTPQQTLSTNASSNILEEVMQKRESLAERVLQVERAVYEIENDLLWAGHDSCQVEQDSSFDAHSSDAAAGLPLDAMGRDAAMRANEVESLPQWFMRDLQISLGKKEEAAAQAASRAAAQAEAAAEQRMLLQAADFARREEEMRSREESSAQKVDELTRQLAALQEEMHAMSCRQQEAAEAQQLRDNECEEFKAAEGLEENLQPGIRQSTRHASALQAAIASEVDAIVDGQGHILESICLNSRSPSVIARSPESFCKESISPMFSNSPAASGRTISGLVTPSLRINPQPYHSGVVSTSAAVSGGSASGSGVGGTGSASTSRSPILTSDGGRFLTPCGSARMLPPDNTSRSLQPIKELQADPQHIKLLPAPVTSSPKV